MREVAEGECWEEFMDFMEGLEGGGIEEFSTEDLAFFHASWYMKVGHTNLGRMYVALAKAIAIDIKARETA